MSYFKWTCSTCDTTINGIQRKNMTNRNGRELILCDDCLAKDAPPASTFSLDGTAYEDVFQLDEFSKLKKVLEARLSEESVADGYDRVEDYETQTQYQVKEEQKTETHTTPSSSDTETPRPSLEEATAKLDALIGLPSVKKSVHELLKSFEGQKKLHAIAKGSIKMEKPTLHMAFTGGDGTGKREVAKALTEILFAAGHIQENKYVETDRSSLVGEHVGSTAPKVIAQVKKALGGVLFVNEASALLSDNGKDFGKEAIATLAKEMETHRDNLVVVLAGLESDMNQLFQEYPSLASRISTRFSFQDYTPKQLASIAQKMLEDRGYDCEGVLSDIEKAIQKASKNGAVEGNGRWVRHFVQKIVQQHVIRYTKDEPENYDIIVKEDIQNAVGTQSKQEQEGLQSVKESALSDLRALVGLGDLKKEVQRIMNFFAVSKRKFEQGIASSKPTMHMIFAGPPGTGKTTVAKIMAQFLKGEGILANGHLKEVSRADLVGAHVGETAIRVKKIIQEALGGILFIDEAYALDGGDNDSFGKEAIDTLIKEMEENRENLIVILAGYENDMKRLLEKNAGFTSRVAYQFEFPNYNIEEILQIVALNFSKQGLLMDDETKTFLEETIGKEAEENDGVIEGNGRWVRNFMDKLLISQSNRIMEEASDDLVTIQQADISDALMYMKKF